MLCVFFEWNFVIAEVKTPIIGSDFIGHFKLLIDVNRGKLIDQLTSLETTGTIASINRNAIKTFTNDNIFFFVYLKNSMTLHNLTFPIQRSKQM